MTMTEDHTPTALEAAQERLEAALAEMERLGRELQALPAQEQEAIRRGDEEAALRIPIRRRILEQRSHEANIARAAAETQVFAEEARAADAEARTHAEAMVQARAQYDQMERALLEKKREVAGLLGRSQIAQRQAEDLHHKAREAQGRYDALVAGRQAGGQ